MAKFVQIIQTISPSVPIHQRLTPFLSVFVARIADKILAEAYGLSVSSIKKSSFVALSALTLNSGEGDKHKNGTNKRTF